MRVPQAAPREQGCWLWPQEQNTRCFLPRTSGVGEIEATMLQPRSTNESWHGGKKASQKNSELGSSRFLLTGHAPHSKGAPRAIGAFVRLGESSLILRRLHDNCYISDHSQTQEVSEGCRALASDSELHTWVRLSRSSGSPYSANHNSCPGEKTGKDTHQDTEEVHRRERDRQTHREGERTSRSNIQRHRGRTTPDCDGLRFPRA